jgi:hypothetical protein
MSAASASHAVAAAPPWLAVMRALWQQRRNQGKPWPWIVFAGLLLLGAGWLWQHAPHGFVWALAGVIGGSLLLGAWWIALFGLVLQNDALSARLVPRHLRQLRVALLVGWAAVSVLVALIAMASIGHPVQAVALASALQLFILLIVRWPMAALPIWALASTAGWWWPHALAHRAGLVFGEVFLHRPDVLAIASVAMAGLGAALLFQRGGERHRRSDRWRRRWLDALQLRRSGAPLQLSMPVAVQPLQRLLESPYQAWLRFALSRPSASPMARAWLGLGPRVHWTAQCVALVFFALVMTVVASSASLHGAIPRRLPTGTVIGPAIGLLMMALAPVFQAPAFEQTRREQALLMLAPGVPQGAALNRAIARRQIAQIGVGWAIAVALASLASVHFDADPTWAWAAALGALPVAPLAWRDWSRLPAGAPTRHLHTVLLAMLSVGASLGLRALHWPMPVLAGLALIVAASLALWRWVRLQRAPAAWPVGRLR